MKPVFKAYNQGQSTLFPVSLDSKISQDLPVRLVNQVVDNLNISKVIDSYKGGGTSSYPPRVMLKIVIFAYLPEFRLIIPSSFHSNSHKHPSQQSKFIDRLNRKQVLKLAKQG
jgi:hypothetical protein